MTTKGKREGGVVENKRAQADLSNRSRLTEQKEHAGPRCPDCSVFRTSLPQVGVLGLKDGRGGRSVTHIQIQGQNRCCPSRG